MGDSFISSLPLRPKRGRSPSSDDPSAQKSPSRPATKKKAVGEASVNMEASNDQVADRTTLQPKESRAQVRKLEKLREIEKNWGDPETGEPYRGFLPKEIRPREIVNGERALIGNTEARILENEEWSSNLVDALWNLSFGSLKGNRIGAMSRLTQAVYSRNMFGSTGQGQLPNQFVIEVLPSDVWILVAKYR